MPYFYLSDVSSEPDVIAELSAQSLTAESAEEVDEETGEKLLYLYIGDGESACEIRHEVGDPMVAVRRLRAAADAMRDHAARIEAREGRNRGWT